MGDLSRSEREFVALGAAIGSNCVPCVQFHIAEARKAGLTEAQISEAVRLADKVRRVPAQKVLDTALGLLGESPEVSAPAQAGAPCDGPAPSVGQGDPCCG